MKLLIRSTNWVGDAILSLPALQAVRRRFPEAHIAILARPYVAEIYRDQEICDELIDYDAKGQHRGWKGRERLAEDLRARNFDVALLLQNAFDAAWIAWRSKIPERMGYARDGRGVLLTKALRVPKEGEIPRHEKFYYLELLRRAGWVDRLPDDEPVCLRVPEAARKRAALMLAEAGARPDTVRMAVGAGASYGSAKCWAPERFAKVLNDARSSDGIDVILFGTEAEARVSEVIKNGLRHPPVDLTGKTRIADLPALLTQCHLFLGNDSGAMHVAAAVGLPVVAVFGPTDSEGTAPLTPRASIVQQKPYCSPCFLRHCPTDHRCMNGVTVELVEIAVRARLAEVLSA